MKFVRIYKKKVIINYFGGGCFRLQSGETSLLLDPENNRLKADLTLRTLTATDNVPNKSASGGEEFSFPGEYEVKGIEILGFSIQKESTEKFLKTAYVVIWEEIVFAFLGHISKLPDPELLDKLGEPDVLILPVGGGHFLADDAAAKLARQLEPSFVIPSFSKNPSSFLKAIGSKAERQEKLVFKKKDLGVGKMQVIALEAKS